VKLYVMINGKRLLLSLLLCCVILSAGLYGCRPSVDLEIVGTITLPGSAKTIAINKETNLVYAVCFIVTEETRTYSLLVINGANDEVTAEIPLDLERGCSALVVNEQTNRIYAVGEYRIIAIDGATNSLIAETISWGSIAVNPSTNLVYMTCITRVMGSKDRVYVYDGETLEEVAILDLPDTSPFIEKVGVAVNPKTNMVYVTWSGGEEHLYKIDGNTHEFIGDVTTPYKSVVMVNPYSNYVYIDDVVDGETLETVYTEYIGDVKAIDAVNNFIFSTTGFNRNELLILDGTTHKVMGSLKIEKSQDYWDPDGWSELAVNPMTSKVYAICKRGNTPMDEILVLQLKK
jgi:DNA-binding beta-propeller fold protein YncE